MDAPQSNLLWTAFWSRLDTDSTWWVAVLLGVLVVVVLTDPRCRWRVRP